MSSHNDTNVSLRAAAHACRGSHTKVTVRPQPSGHTRMPTLPLTPTGPCLPAQAPAQAHHTLKAPSEHCGSPILTSDPEDHPLPSATGEGGWTFWACVTCPENRG